MGSGTELFSPFNELAVYVRRSLCDDQNVVFAHDGYPGSTCGQFRSVLDEVFPPISGNLAI